MSTAFVSVAVVAVGFILCESTLRWGGVKPLTDTQDPFVGFTAYFPLFVEEEEEDGRTVLVTAENKHRYFIEQHASTIDPMNPEVWYDVALSALGLARKEDAVRLEPDVATSRYNLGLALLKSDNSNRAIDQFNHIYEEMQNYAPLQYHLGAALSDVGRRDEAVLHLRQALRLQPAYPAALRTLAEVQSSKPNLP